MRVESSNLHNCHMIPADQNRNCLQEDTNSHSQSSSLPKTSRSTLPSSLRIEIVLATCNNCMSSDSPPKLVPTVAPSSKSPYWSALFNVDSTSAENVSPKIEPTSAQVQADVKSLMDCDTGLAV